METKICSKCKRELPIENFQSDRSSKDGFYSSCKDCKRIYRANNKKMLADNQAIRRQSQKERLAEYGAKYRKEHKTEAAEYQAKYQPQYYQDNRDAIIKRAIEYSKSPIGKLVTAKARQTRRARKWGVHREKIDPLKIFIEFEHRCFICGREDNLTLDHIVPLYSGGADANSNLSVLCFNCNSTKRYKSPYLFFDSNQIEKLRQMGKAI